MPDGTKPEVPALAPPQVQGWSYFPSNIYTIEMPDFLNAVKEVSDERLEWAKKQKELDPIFPVVMTDSYFADPRLQDFCGFVGSTAWNILEGQGYAMEGLSTSFTEMWTQEHYKHSLMEQHVHGNGSQIIGFYFLEVPENSSNVVFHDPKAGKVQVNLPEANIANISPASIAVNFNPKPGLFMFANSWLPHSFGRHGSDKPLQFVHFNLIVQPMPKNCEIPPAEVV